MDTLQAEKENLLDLIFPYFCLICGTETNTAAPHYLCHECRIKMLRPQGASCRICTTPLAVNETKDTCPDCRKQKPQFQYKAAYAPTIYHGLARQLLILMKSAKKKILLKPMAHMMVEFGQKHIPDIKDYDLVLAVPMHWTKLTLRGFNQARELAHIIAQTMDIPTADNTISRRMFSAVQKRLSQKQRSINALTSFRQGKNIGQAKDKNILLIDDILTTGATAAECSRLLVQAGAKKVSVLVFAGTEQKSKKTN